MTLKLSQRIELIATLAPLMIDPDERFSAVIQQTYIHNKWFTVENIRQSLTAIAEQMLDKDKLTNWALDYGIGDNQNPQKVALVMAGNIPMVGFHDLLSVFIAGHYAQIKLSDKDKFILPYLFDRLKELEPATSQYFEVVEQLKNFDRVIATGSDNSARYFEAYFGKYLNIIRKNRTSIAILDGTETEEELVKLGHDIFDYFGLGCRNVSKLMVPKDYDFNFFLSTIHDHFKELAYHNKYKNNFDYNYTLFILNKQPVYNNGCLLLVEDENLFSRIATLHYSYYENPEDLVNQLKVKEEQIQCIVAKQKVQGLSVLDFGQAQQPGLTDYADGVDTMKFLLG